MCTSNVEWSLNDLKIKDGGTSPNVLTDESTPASEMKNLRTDPHT